VLVPFYYHRSDPAAGSSLLVTPLFGRAGQGDRSRWLLLPGLAAMTRDRDDRSLWLLGPLAHARWGGGRAQSHVLPLYYYDGEDDLFLSPLYSAGGTPERRWSFLLPAYYYGSEPARGTSRLLTPILARFAQGQRASWYFLPTLGALKTDREDRDLWMLGPLAHARWGGGHRQSHLLPLYYHDREEDAFFSLPFSRVGGADGFWNVLGLLAHSSDDDGGHRTVRVLPPLTAFAKNQDYGRASVYPLFSTERRGDRRETWVFPWAFAESSAKRSKNSFFPFWLYRSSQDPAAGYSRDLRVLGWLWEDLQKNVGATAKQAPPEYVRKRVLWKLFDYERDGRKKTRAMDCFPFISWDSHDSGFRRYAFGWRIFRWQRSADGGRKLDLLFIPLMRRAGEPKPAPKEPPEQPAKAARPAEPAPAAP
jgi:hypothetical protein